MKPNLVYLIVVCLSTFCVCPPTHAQTNNELRIGAVLGLTGYAQRWGENARMAMELAADEINSKGGIKGKRVRLIMEDSRSEAASSVSAYHKLVNRDRVEIVVGDVWEYLTVPLIPLSARDRVVLISPTVMDASVTETSPYFFTFGHRFEGLEPGVELFFVENPEMRRLATVCAINGWNQAFVDVVTKVALRSNVSIASSTQIPDFTPSFRNEVLGLRKAHADGVFVTWQSEVLLQRLKEQKLEIPLLSSSDALEALWSRVADRQSLNGVYFLNWEANKEFREAFFKKFGVEPYNEAHNAYEIIRSIAKALAAPTGELRENLLTVRYEGVGGPIDFGYAPFVNRAEGKLYQVRDGRAVLVNRTEPGA